MKLIKLIGIAGILTIAWKILKTGKHENSGRKPGPFSRMIKGIFGEIKKPLNRTDDNIPEPVGKVEGTVGH